MSALVLDAGALIAVERNDRAMVVRLRIAMGEGLGVRTHAMIVAQVWRGMASRQANLARLLDAIEVIAVDEAGAAARAVAAVSRAANGMAQRVRAVLVEVNIPPWTSSSCIGRWG